MVVRISENMKFNAINESLAKSQRDYTSLMEKLASQKMINRPSDDPIGMSKVLGFRKTKASVEQYQKNIGSCESWLMMTESTLSSANDLLIKAKEIAIAQSTATSSNETRDIAAMEVQQIIEQMQTLANTQYNGRYIFAGTQTDQVPFSSSASDGGTIGPVKTAENNTYTNVTSDGIYTGAVNKTYVVKIVTGGSLADAEYQVSDDGGKTWSTSRDDLDGSTINLGDGINLTFNDTVTETAIGDIFYLQTQAPGCYQGNGEKLSIEIGKDVNFEYSISGESVFTDQGDGVIDIFEVLADLKTALEDNDPDGIGDQLDNLQTGTDQINQNIAECGVRINRLEAAQNTLLDLDLNLTKMISNTEDADFNELVTKLAMKETALEASYATASKIGNLTILDFLR